VTAYTGFEVREALYDIFTDFINYDKDLKWIRSDGDSKFTSIRRYIEMIGVRWIVSPPDIKTVRAERQIRSLRDLARTLVTAMEYKLPREWVPYCLKDATVLLNIKPTDTSSPYEMFTGLKPEL
jgi:hypothetical protein